MLYVLVHTHRHGTSVYEFYCDLPTGGEVDEESAALVLDIDYEKDREDEYLDLYAVDQDKIPTITPAQLFAAAVKLDDGETEDEED